MEQQKLQFNKGILMTNSNHTEQDFYFELAKRESSNIRNKVNRRGYIGLYQMGEMALVDAGYYEKFKKTEAKQYNNDWTGTWTGKNGITSKESFLNNEAAQTMAVKEYHKKTWYYIRNLHGEQSRIIESGGKKVTLTKSGMIAAAHLVGQSELKIYVSTNGRKDPTDGNKVHCSEYLKLFEGYELVSY